MAPKRVPVHMRFWSKTVRDPRTGCLVWTGAKNLHGYGFIKAERKQRYAHRIAWELARGPIPPKMFVLHHCDNPPCVNPEHLFLGTLSDNALDAFAKGRRSEVGVDNACAKLTDSDVRMIRRLHAKAQNSNGRVAPGTRPLLAARFNVSKTIIDHVATRKSWTHVS